jgi:hypothetical protein
MCSSSACESAAKGAGIVEEGLTAGLRLALDQSQDDVGPTLAVAAQGRELVDDGDLSSGRFWALRRNSTSPSSRGARERIKRATGKCEGRKSIAEGRRGPRWRRWRAMLRLKKPMPTL